MFAKRLKELREQRGISQKQLAEHLQVAQGAVGNWESGVRRPTVKRLQQLAEFFGVSVDELLDTAPKKGVPVPVLGVVRAGIPIEAVEEILDYEEIDAATASSGNFFALRVQGDSMEPRITEGDVVVVRQQADVDSGDVAVVLVNGNEATVKKLVKHENGISLVAFNPKYAPLYFTAEEVSTKPVTVVGKVIELRGKF